MHTALPVYGLYYEVEVGLFWGAMCMLREVSPDIVLAIDVMLFYLVNDLPV